MCFRVMFMSLSSVHDALGVVSSLNSLKFIELRIPYGFEQKSTEPIPSNNSRTYYWILFFLLLLYSRLTELLSVWSHVCLAVIVEE